MSQERFISKTDAKRLLRKLEMKYGAELQAITAKMAQDQLVYGFVSMETEAKREELFNRIKQEEKHYR